MNNEKLLLQIDKFNEVKVLVIGDIMLDNFIYGEVNRISPEAPVPIFKFKNNEEILGGAGNVVANLSSLGCNVKFIGIVGADENGRKLSKLLSNIRVNCHLLKLKDYKTITKTRLISQHNHILRFDEEEKLPIIEALIPRFEKILVKVLKDVDIVLISDYNKGLLTSRTTQIIINYCNQMNKKVLVDPKGLDYSKYNNCYLLKPNLKEFSEATGRVYNPKDEKFLDEIRIGAKELFKKYNIQNLVITLSEYGMLYVSKKDVDNIYKIDTYAREVCDVTGAGDTTISTLSVCVGRNLDFRDALHLSNISAGISISKLGTATVSGEELKNALIKLNVPNIESVDTQRKKILTLKELIEKVQTLKKEGKKIGFTNGCYDCCHLGHLNSFLEAKKYCDILVVAINSDASIKRYKGSDRPIQDEKTRITLVSSLECVDYCILFTEDTPLDIVKAIRPDVIAKQGYTIDKWIEAQFVKSYGGEIIFLNKIEGYSTTNLVKKIKGSY